MRQEDLAAIFEENRARLRGCVSRLIHAQDEADDLLQETFLRAQAGLASFRGDSKPFTWLYSIATNVCLDHLKSAGRRHFVQTPPEVLREIAEAGDPAEGPRLSASLLLDQAAMGSCVRRLMEDLPPDFRIALLLHDIEGMTSAEVAAAVGCSLANAKIRLHRARERLREILGRRCSFGRDERGVFVCEPKPDSE